MAENNQNFDLFGGLNRLFSWIDRMFNIIDKQYAEDGSFKYDWVVSKNGPVLITVKGIPSKERGLYDVQFSTTAEIANDTETPYVKRGVNIGDIPQILADIKHMWFGDKYDEKEENPKSQPKNENTNPNDVDHENTETSNQKDDGTEVDEGHEFPLEEDSNDYGYSNRFSASRVLRFGISKIEGSHELQLTKVYANYETDLALSDLNAVFDEFDFNDYEDACFYEVCPDDDELCVYESQDFGVDYCSIIDDMLCRLYEIYIREKAYHKMFSDNLDLQVFFSINPTIESMIDYLNDKQFSICGTLQDPAQYCFSECAYGNDTESNQLCYCYIGNLTEVLNSLNLFMCNFDSDTQSVLQSYQNQIQSYLDELQTAGFYFPEYSDEYFDDGEYELY